MAGQGPLNYTTQIAAEKSAFECLELLHRYGAQRHGLVNDKSGTPIGLAFVIETQWGPRPFEVMVDSKKTLNVLKLYAGQGKIRASFATPEQAVKVAWRVIKMWLEAQLSLIEAGLLSAEQALAGNILVAPNTSLLDSYSQAQLEIESR